MEGQPKTSFIPKRPIQVTTKEATISSSTHKSKSIFSFIAIVIFLATLASLGGVYFYKFTLGKKIESQVESLKQTKEEFDEKFIADATRLNTRMTSAIKLLENHLSPSMLYSLLEKHTLQTVSFNNFSFSDTKDGNIAITGSGDAKRYETIVLQSDSFGDSEYMRNVIFDNLSRDLEKGVVGFDFSATLDPQIVLYKNSLSSNVSN